MGPARAVSNFSIGSREAVSARISTRFRSARPSASRPQPLRCAHSAQRTESASTSPSRLPQISASLPAPAGPPAVRTLTAQGAAILGVIDAKDEEVLQLVPTFNVPAVTTGPMASQHPAGTAQSVTVDAKNNHIFVALGANNVYPNCSTGCIAVYGHGDEDEPGEAATPP
jgi:hypothetical protein